MQNAMSEVFHSGLVVLFINLGVHWPPPSLCYILFLIPPPPHDNKFASTNTGKPENKLIADLHPPSTL
jgi:hypothetical protein